MGVSMTPDEIKAKLVAAVTEYTTSPTARDDLHTILNAVAADTELSLTILRALSLGYTQGYAKGAGLLAPQPQGADNGPQS